ncbi:MAG: hypothetical protein AAF067_11720 [Pseudomonadota bacterium]
MTNIKPAKLVTATVILALGLSAQAAQAKGSDQYQSNGNQQQVGLLLPAVQKVRASNSSSSQDGRDLLIVNNGDGSDFFEIELRKLFRYLAPRE